MPVTNEERRAVVLKGIESGLSVGEIAEICGVQYTAIAQYLGRLTDLGVIVRVGRGKYQIANGNGNGHHPPAPARNGRSVPAPATSRRVDLPAHMKQRQAVMLFVERSPIEIEKVVRLEIQVAGNWMPGNPRSNRWPPSPKNMPARSRS